ncbi:hypothetical protein GE061_012725 [Apolygus lucorum]|uniref:Oxysterol-binding protein n=1 Tax=Apolygus lucorum TaxID=248454 RepID=A0A8S9XUD3_APOLU|nr:hypothetical protein GE061_012725 [Apolygus lucorum]
MEMFCSSTSVLIKACADYTHQSGKVVDLITKTKHLARISSSEDESQVYYDCEDVEPSSEASHSFVDNIRVHKLYSAVVSKDDQAGPSSSPGGPRRKRVPDRPPVPMNIWSTLKNAVNSDMSKMALPVAFSEPLSALQRLNEDFEYSEILDKASNVDDPGEQLAYVAGFAVSAYSNSSNRVTKPFNPLLGETFECDRTDDRGWKSISEQVSHHPPISAVHCEGRQWECWQEQSLITKFRGQYLQITPVGEVNLNFTLDADFSWRTNKIKGVVTDAKNNTQYHINGGYESRVEIIKASDLVKGKRGKTLSTIPPLIVWEKEASPPDSEKYYCFTLFACQLNEIEDGVAPTDSRHRPDQRLMEEGKWDAANELKLALEEAQRKRGQESKPPHKPVWFSQQKDPDTKTVMYKHNGDYWECKKKKTGKGVLRYLLLEENKFNQSKKPWRNQEEMEYTCRGTLSLRGATIYSEESNNFIVSNGETYHIKAPTDAEKSRWVEALISARAMSLDQDAPNKVIDTSVTALTTYLKSKLEEVRSCNELMNSHHEALGRSLSEFESATSHDIKSKTKEMSEKWKSFEHRQLS